MNKLDENMNIICEKLNKFMEEYFSSGLDIEKTLLDAMKYSVLSGGKRLRACMIIMFYEFFGGKSDIIYYVAAALEMVHAYSLIHDDLPCMDDDEFRRGKKCTHVVYGEALGLLAGDALLSQAFEILSSEAVLNEFGDKIAVKVMKELAKKAGAGGMVSGQAADIYMDIKNSEYKNFDENTILNMYKRKTAFLFSASAKIGAICASASNDVVSLAEEYGMTFGFAFQICDDLMDMEKDKNEKGKVTYAVEYGKEKSELALKRYMNNLEDIAKKLNFDSSHMGEIIKKVFDNYLSKFA